MLSFRNSLLHLQPVSIDSLFCSSCIFSLQQKDFCHLSCMSSYFAFLHLDQAVTSCHGRKDTIGMKSGRNRDGSPIRKGPYISPAFDFLHKFIIQSAFLSDNSQDRILCHLVKHGTNQHVYGHCRTERITGKTYDGCIFIHRE